MTERVASGRVWRRPGWLLRLHRVRPAGCVFLLWTTRRGCVLFGCRTGHRVKLPGVHARVRVASVHPHPGNWYFAAVELTADRTTTPGEPGTTEGGT